MRTIRNAWRSLSPRPEVNQTRACALLLHVSEVAEQGHSCGWRILAHHRSAMFGVIGDDINKP